MSSPDPHRSSLPAFMGVLLTGVAALLLLAGCGSREVLPTRPPAPDAATPRSARSSALETGAAAHGWAAYYPLAVGNRWHYRERIALTAVADDGSEWDWGEIRGYMDARLTGERTIGGQVYMVEERTFGEDATDMTTTDQLCFRQDESGLYETMWSGAAGIAGVRGSAAPDRSPLSAIGSRVEAGLPRPISGEAFRSARLILERKLGLIAPRFGPAPTGIREVRLPDLVRLEYPLSTRAQWSIESDPLYTAEVEGFEVLSLAAGRFPGWRMRYNSVLYGPRDVVHVWYGRDGYLSLAAHLEASLVDEEGNRLGTLIAQYDERLDEIDLVGPQDRP